MSDQAIVQAAMFTLPVIFLALWLLIGFLMPKFTGWSKLEEQFPDRPDEAFVERFFFQALYITTADKSHLGPSYRGCVTFAACKSGLRISIWKAFQPFSKPIFLPWEDIEAVTSKVIGIKVCTLLVGQDPRYKLSIIARVARQIERITGGKLGLPADLA